MYFEEILFYRAPRTLNTTAEMKDVIVMEIEVKGTTEPFKIFLEPYSIHIPGELFIGTTINRKFKVAKRCLYQSPFWG